MGVPAVYPLMSVPVHAGRAAVTLVGSANTGPALAHAAFAGPRSVSRSSGGAIIGFRCVDRR